jgi:hypothetical protein
MATLTGKFLGDWEAASEDLYREAEEGIADVEYIALIEKIDNAPKKKRGKFSFVITVELTERETELLRNEAEYRMKFWSLVYQDCKSDIDRSAHKAAKKLFLELGGVITEKMALEMGIKVNA